MATTVAAVNISTTSRTSLDTMRTSWLGTLRSTAQPIGTEYSRRPAP
ncbi:hypothetical protein ACWD7C_39500 [Streptomyces sp. NPDC005134]